MTSRAPLTLTVFEHSPDDDRKLARNMRIRWALEELGQHYEICPVSFTEMKEPAHLALHPFGQIPTLAGGNLTLFESGAIILDIASHHDGECRLLPGDRDARARAITWMFASVSTVEPPIIERDAALYQERDKPWFEPRLELIKNRIRVRLDALARHLGDQDWLEGVFTAGDLMVADVLRRLGGTTLLAEYPKLAAYVARSEARPAFTRAFDAQRAFL